MTTAHEIVEEKEIGESFKQQVCRRKYLFMIPAMKLKPLKNFFVMTSLSIS